MGFQFKLIALKPLPYYPPKSVKLYWTRNIITSKILQLTTGGFCLQLKKSIGFSTKGQ